MCIICVKSNKALKPDYLTLMDMAQANPDLCGVAYCAKDSENVEVWRGLDISELLTIHDTIPQDSLAIYHFRISTSGNVDTMNSHPFPLYEDKKKRHVTAKIALAHNGIFGSGSKNYSDTFHLVTMLEKLPYADGIRLLGWLCDFSNKVATISTRGINLFGTFKNTKDEYNNAEYLVSNEYYKSWYKKTYTYKKDGSLVVTPSNQWESLYKTSGECKICSTPLIGKKEIESGICLPCKSYHRTKYGESYKDTDI